MYTKAVARGCGGALSARAPPSQKKNKKKPCIYLILTSILINFFPLIILFVKC